MNLGIKTVSVTIPKGCLTTMSESLNRQPMMRLLLPPRAAPRIKIDIKYQVLDQQSPAQPINSSSMIPHEKGTFFSGTPYDSDIGPVSGYPTSGKYTASDGTFHDVPLGVCGTGVFGPLTATQNITIVVGTNSYPVRSQTWTASGTSAGHGNIKNAVSPTNATDVSASR